MTPASTSTSTSILRCRGVRGGAGSVGACGASEVCCTGRGSLFGCLKYVALRPGRGRSKPPSRLDRVDTLRSRALPAGGRSFLPGANLSRQGLCVDVRVRLFDSVRPSPRVSRHRSRPVSFTRRQAPRSVPHFPSVPDAAFASLPCRRLRGCGTSRPWGWHFAHPPAASFVSSGAIRTRFARPPLHGFAVRRRGHRAPHSAPDFRGRR